MQLLTQMEQLNKNMFLNSNVTINYCEAKGSVSSPILSIKSCILTIAQIHNGITMVSQWYHNGINTFDFGVR